MTAAAGKRNNKTELFVGNDALEGDKEALMKLSESAKNANRDPRLAMSLPPSKNSKKNDSEPYEPYEPEEVVSALPS